MIDKLLEKIRWYVGEQYPEESGQWELDFHVYGRGQTTPEGPGEVFIVAEVVASSQQLATNLASKARIAMIVRLFTDRFLSAVFPRCHGRAGC